MHCKVSGVLNQSANADSRAAAEMPADFADEVHASITAAIDRRLPHLTSVLEDL